MNTGIRIMELEELIKQKFEEDKQANDSWYTWRTHYGIKTALDSLINYQYDEPYTIASYNWSSTNPRYIVKAKNAGTKIIDIAIACHDENGNNWGGNIKSIVLDEVIVTPITKKVHDFDSLVDYLNERTTICDNKAKGKVDAFVDILNSKGINVDDFFELENEFYRLDGSTKMYLQRMKTK